MFAHRAQRLALRLIVVGLVAVPAVPVLAATTGASAEQVASGRHPASSSSPSVVRLIAGNRAAHVEGRRWAPDDKTAIGGHVTTTNRNIKGTRQDGEFQRSRVGVRAYRVPVAQPGRYRVTLDMTTPRSTASTFSVRADGRTVLHHVRLTRSRHAYRKSFRATAGSMLRMRFVSKRGKPVVDSLVVRRMSTGRAPGHGGSTPPTSPPPKKHEVVLTPEDFGAVGDGRTDDSTALQLFFDAGSPNNELMLPRGKVFAHSAVLHLQVPGETLVGPGTLLATAEATSGVWLQANNITVNDVVFRVASTTKRWVAFEQMEVLLSDYSGITLENDTVAGSAAAGIYIGGASHFTLDHVTVANTRADGIQMTQGASHGKVVSPTTINTGDDGISTVSYQQDGVPCHNIVVTGAHVFGTAWGRGMSVVGGSHIRYQDIYIRASDAAALYIAAEGAPYYTAAPTDVTVTHAKLVDSNVDPQVDQGAVLVNSGETQVVPRAITFDHIRIVHTRATAARNVGVVSMTPQPRRIAFDGFTIKGGPSSVYQGNAQPSSFTIHNWIVNGSSYPNHG